MGKEISFFTVLDVKNNVATFFRSDKHLLCFKTKNPKEQQELSAQSSVCTNQDESQN